MRIQSYTRDSQGYFLKTTKVKLFDRGNSQAVSLPKGFDFPDGGDVFLQRDEVTGDVLVSRRPGSQVWGGFFGLLLTIEEPPSYFGSARPLNLPLTTGDGSPRA